MEGWTLKRVRHDGRWVGFFLTLLMLVLAFPTHAQSFPALTGRVVDDAGILQPDQKAALEAKLSGIEQSTGHQVVVATIRDMQGYPLEDYGYRLGRNWKIGSKDQKDGVVVLLAPNNPAGQRGPRIEVGYGLEPLLTDAYSSVIARSVMVPKLRAGDIAGALSDGVDAIAEQIKLTPEEAAKRSAALTKQSQQRSHAVNPGAFIFWIVIILFIIIPLVRSMAGGRRYRGGGGGVASGIGNVILWSAINGALNSRGGSSDWGGGGGGSDWGGGGGFSGGGGDFGGGGASGDW